MVTRIEEDIFKKVMSETISFETGQRAMRDPDAWKLSPKGRTSESSRRTDFVKTPRAIISYCWYVHRNEAGYFIGFQAKWKNGKVISRDQLIARKSKKRLALHQKKKAAALAAKYAKAMDHV